MSFCSQLFQRVSCFILVLQLPDRETGDCESQLPVLTAHTDYIIITVDDRQKLLNSAFSVAAMRNSNDSIKSIQGIMRVVSTNVFSQSS